MLLCLHTYTFDYYYNGKVHFIIHKRKPKVFIQVSGCFCVLQLPTSRCWQSKNMSHFPLKIQVSLFSLRFLIFYDWINETFFHICTLCSIIYHFGLSNQRATIFCLFLHNSRHVLTLDHFRGILDTVYFVFLASLWLWLVRFTYFVKIRRRELCSKKTARWLVVFLFLP